MFSGISLYLLHDFCKLIGQFVILALTGLHWTISQSILPLYSTYTNNSYQTAYSKDAIATLM